MLKSRSAVIVCLFLLIGILSSCFRSAPPKPQATEEITPQSIILTKPANGGELALGTDISVTFNEAMNAASVERSVSIFPGTYDPSKNPATFTTLQLTSMCNGKWRVRNPNAVAISFTWDIYNTTTKGLGVVPGNSDVFFYTSTGSNTVRVFVGTKQQQVKATNPAACTGQPFTFSWSTDSRTVSFKPTDPLADGKAYTVVISTAVRNANNQANQTAAYAFGVRVEDYNKYIDPSIQGAERDVMLKALVGIRPQDRENVIFRDASGNYYTNREFLKAYLNSDSPQGNLQAPSNTNLTPAVAARVPGVTQFVGSIELQPLQTDSVGSPVATNTDGAGGGGYQTCERPDSGPEYQAIHKPVSEIQGQAFLDKLRLGDPRGSVNYPTIQYMSMDVTLPTFVDLWEPTLTNTANCRNQRYDGSGNPRYNVPANIADIPGEGFYAFPGFWLPNYANPNEDPNNPDDNIIYGTKFEGGISYNCDADKYSLFTEPLRIASKVLEPGNTARWGTPGQKVKIEQYFDIDVNAQGYTYITKMTYKVSSLSTLADGKDNFTFSFEPDAQAAIIGKAQDVQDIVWANSFGLAQDHEVPNPNAQDGKHPPVESGSVVQGLEFSNVMIAGCKDCTPFAWEASNQRAPSCTTPYIASPDLSASTVKLDFAACTNKITSGEDAGQCDTDLDGIADYKERQNGTNPFDPNDPGMGRGEVSIQFSGFFTAYATPEFPDYAKKRQTFYFSNIGTAPLNYTVTTDAPWLSILSSATGSLAPNAQAAIEMEASSCTVVGETPGSITVSAEGLPSQTVAATFRCNPPRPSISVSDRDGNGYIFVEGETGGTATGTGDIHNFYGETPGTFEIPADIPPLYTPKLSFSPTSGTLLPGESMPLTISIPCKGYYESLRRYPLIRNTPRFPYTEFNIYILCHGPLPSNVDWSRQFTLGLGQTTTDMLTIHNIGDRDLVISVTSNVSWASVNASQTIAPGGRTEIPITVTCPNQRIDYPYNEQAIQITTNESGDSVLYQPGRLTCQ